MYKFVKNSFSGSKGIAVSNQKIVRAVDSIEDDVVINKYGHVRNDFAILMDTSDGMEFARALANMQSAYEQNSSQFDGMTFEQMVSSVRPRWCQLPGEVDRFEQYLIDNALEFYKNLRKDEISNLEDEGVNAESVKKPATLAPTTQPSE